MRTLYLFLHFSMLAFSLHGVLRARSLHFIGIVSKHKRDEKGTKHDRAENCIGKRCLCRIANRIRTKFAWRLYRGASQGFPFPLSLSLPLPSPFFPAPSLSLPFPSPLKPWVSKDDSVAAR